MGQSPKMVALVIGNSDYQTIGPLSNPKNDADLVGAALLRMGFRLTGGGVRHDLTLDSLRQSLAQLSSDASNADVVVIYYAGHGIQINGENYLVPVDANPHSPDDVQRQMLSATDVLSILDIPHTRVKLLILDACRNNPFATRGLSLTGSGLADMATRLPKMSAREGTFIWFATQPGNVAVDGIGNNGPFAKAINRNIGVAGRDIYEVFNAASIEVIDATQQRQYPWLSASPIRGAFYFVSVTGRSEFTASDPRQSSIDRLTSIFAKGVHTATRKFSFGQDYRDVNKSLDAPFSLPRYDGLPRAGEFGSDDVRYFWVPVTSLPFLVSSILPEGLGDNCIAPGSYFVFFFKKEKLFHVSMRFAKSGQCQSYDWVWNRLFPDGKRSATLQGGPDGGTTSVVAHELQQYSILEVTQRGVADERAAIFHE
ncbi:caspase family protein [Cupriavidus sp. DF5525]|uniref:caspase family protein n=1 Tax=Cupriavidus sp. DF5525 TaxID=3160989 RepID=UPI0032E03585